MNATYRNALAQHGASLITHIGLVNGAGTELSGGDYARQPVTWATSPEGTNRPSTDLVFGVPAGANVSGWRGFTAASGGTDYDGAGVPSEDFNEAGTYTLATAQTAVHHAAGS
jgi:hypothetical protein